QMVLSVCNWGKQNPWTWAPGMSTMWRTSQDIIFFGESPSMDRVLANFDAAQHPEAQSAGHYNDPDMLVAGMPGFTAAQNRTHLGSKTTGYTVSVPAHEAVLLTVTGTEAPGGPRVGAVVGQQSQRCLDINNSATANGTQAQLWDCNSQDNQRWTATAGNQLAI